MADGRPGDVGALMDRAWRVGLTLAYGMLRGWWFVARPRTRGVYVALWCEGRLLVVQNSYRRAATLPGGGLRAGEEPLAGAVRELREEVGVAVAPEALAFAGVYVARSEFTEEHAHFFECELPREPAVEIDRREVIAAAFQRPESALEQPLRQAVRLYLADRGGA